MTVTFGIALMLTLRRAGQSVKEISLLCSGRGRLAPGWPSRAGQQQWVNETAQGQYLLISLWTNPFTSQPHLFSERL